jgi:hypothetical protein
MDSDIDRVVEHGYWHPLSIPLNGFLTFSERDHELISILSIPLNGFQNIQVGDKEGGVSVKSFNSIEWILIINGWRIHSRR